MTKAGRLLLSRGADINHKDHSGVWHPLKGHFLLFESPIIVVVWFILNLGIVLILIVV